MAVQPGPWQCVGQCLFVGSVLTLVADNARPPVGAVAAIFPHIAFSSIGTVVARQTAVAAESVIQAHWKHKNQTLSVQVMLTSF